MRSLPDTSTHNEQLWSCGQHPIHLATCPLLNQSLILASAIQTQHTRQKCLNKLEWSRPLEGCGRSVWPVPISLSDSISLWPCTGLTKLQTTWFYQWGWRVDDTCVYHKWQTEVHCQHALPLRGRWPEMCKTEDAWLDIFVFQDHSSFVVVLLSCDCIVDTKIRYWFRVSTGYGCYNVT